MEAAMKKIRTIITQDAEVDDQNSLRHFLLYANEVDLQGIIQTSSTFHWIGVPGKVRPPQDPAKKRRPFAGTPAPFDQPYRWPGTDWMFQVIDDYEKDYPNLSKHAAGYPTPDELRAITKIGGIGYEGDMDEATEGSELIRQHILDEDPRTLYLQAWGGPNTIARALRDVEEEYKDTPEWPEMHAKISKKVVITACGEQDDTYRSYIAEQWPDIMYVHCMGTYGYGWLRMPEGECKDDFRAAFMVPEILNGKSALANGYCTWMDGHHYEGEEEASQFGSNPNILNEWFGAKFIGGAAEKYDFLSEGDSPSFFLLFDWGFRTTENFENGGFSGRYHKADDQFNSKGQLLNLWYIDKDHYTDKDGNDHMVDSMWPFVADIQRDWAARVSWCGADAFEEAEHKPTLTVTEGLDFEVAPGENLVLHAEAGVPDAGVNVAVTWKNYVEAGAECAADMALEAGENCCTVTVPANAKSGDKLYINVKAQADGHHRLVRYQQVIITVK